MDPAQEMTEHLSMLAEKATLSSVYFGVARVLKLGLGVNASWFGDGRKSVHWKVSPLSKYHLQARTI